ncbi:MAG: ParB N-terminal domain-containing protein [Anaerolineales bacterium]|nr:ParB N-terminal domain-containing protein [Chloroflexota bacterium]MBL6982729.1 ParB N-terminal domain-containing protein [Anaerolineales bacterium]
MVHEIPITQITGYENAKPKKALVRSMHDQGFLPAFPVVVTQQDDGSYRLLDGRRRTAAAQAAGLESVLAEVSDLGAALTILAHATRSENPVAELKAYQELQRQGQSMEEIARVGYASLQRVRKIAKLNQLVPEIAGRVEVGEIAPTVAFDLAGLAPEVQRQLAREETITGPLVRTYREVARDEAKLSVAGVTDLFDEPEAATIEDVLGVLSEDTLYAVLAEMPDDNRFTIWRGKVRQALQMHAAGSVAIQLSQPVEAVSI